MLEPPKKQDDSLPHDNVLETTRCTSLGNRISELELEHHRQHPLLKDTAFVFIQKWKRRPRCPQSDFQTSPYTEARLIWNHPEIHAPIRCMNKNNNTNTDVIFKYIKLRVNCNILIKDVMNNIFRDVRVYIYSYKNINNEGLVNIWIQ